MEKVRFGIIGVGNMGFGHLKFFYENKITNGVCTALADSNAKRLDAAKEACLRLSKSRAMHPNHSKTA